MEDKMMMENLLISSKSLCDLYMHGAIEASTSNVKATFEQALKDTLKMQADIYNKMSEKGWYPQTTAEQKQIQQVVQKYQANA